MRVFCYTSTSILSALLLIGQAHAQEQEQPGPSRAPVAAADNTERQVNLPAEDESIYVVQRRAYSKKGKFEITPSFFTSLNNKFVQHYGPSLSLAYHVRENFAVELVTSTFLASNYSSLVLDVRALDPPLEPQRVDLKRMQYFGALSAQFSALYGKFRLQNFLFDWLFGGNLLVDYDFYVTAGAGLVSTIEVCEPPSRGDCGEGRADIGYGERIPEDGADRFKIAGNLGGGLRVFFADFLGLRVELRDIVYADRARDPDGTTTDIRNNLMLFLGLSLLL